MGKYSDVVGSFVRTCFPIEGISSSEIFDDGGFCVSFCGSVYQLGIGGMLHLHAGGIKSYIFTQSGILPQFPVPEFCGDFELLSGSVGIGHTVLFPSRSLGGLFISPVPCAKRIHKEIPAARMLLSACFSCGVLDMAAIFPYRDHDSHVDYSIFLGSFLGLPI